MVTAHVCSTGHQLGQLQGLDSSEDWLTHMPGCWRLRTRTPPGLWREFLHLGSPRSCWGFLTGWWLSSQWIWQII